MTDSRSPACAARLRLRSRGECPPTRPTELVGEFRLRSSTLAYILKYSCVSSDELRAVRVRNRMYQGAMALARAYGRPRFAVTCTGAACASRSRADAMRDASAEAVRLRSRVRELEARLRHAMSGACAERVRLRARVRELEARLRRYKPTWRLPPSAPVPSRSWPRAARSSA